MIFGFVFLYFCTVKINMKIMKTTELRKKLLDSGCTLVRYGANHDIWYSLITQRRFPIPRHTAKEVASGTLKDIAKKSGVAL